MDPTRLDKEIDKVKPASSTSFSQENTLVPIYRLPTEILEIIFILYACDCYYSQIPDSSELKVPSWVSVTYVCRRWRNTATNCPTLWSYVFMTSRRWTKEILARSKQASLKIDADLHEMPPRIFEPVADHVERIEELSLNFPYGNEYRLFLSKFLSIPAPRLRYLEMYGLRVFGQSSSLLPFAGNTPALRTLKLLSCPNFHHSFSPLRLPMGTFLSALGRMSSLVHIHLDGVLAPASDFLTSRTFYTAPEINLPCLSYVVIAAPLSSIVALLSFVQIPLKAQLELSQKDGDSTTHEYKQLLLLLAQRVTTGDLPAAAPIVRSLAIRNKSPLKLVFYATPESDPGYFLNSFLRLALSQAYDVRIIRDLCQSMPLTNVQVLLFVGPPTIETDFWERILGQLPNLRYLRLDRGRMPDIIPLLSLAPSSEDSTSDVREGSNDILVPLLEELALKDIYIPSDHFLRNLFDAVGTRKESRCRLTMTDCRKADPWNRIIVNCVSSWQDGHLHIKDT